MVLAKCNKCGGSGIADTFEQAKNLINHAVGLSRGIKCGDNYNMVKEIKPKGSKTKPKTVTTKPTPKLKQNLLQNQLNQHQKLKQAKLYLKKLLYKNTIIPLI